MIASSLFHFTRSLDTIKIILKSRYLRASYNIENVEDLFLQEKWLAIPMVCFCDIPLKYISNTHTKRYGNYGIGFKKEWGITNKISPILYRIKNSQAEIAFNQISSSIDQFEQQLKFYPSDNQTQSKLLSIVSSFRDNSSKLIGFIKPYQEKSRNNYLDREWRWVPRDSEKTFQKSNSKNNRIFINEKYHLSPDKIPFLNDDINHLVVNNQEDIEELINFVQKLKIERTQKGRLIQKIIDLESIKLDM